MNKDIKLQGIEINEAIDALGIDFSLFKTILKNFKKNNSNSITLIKEALNNNDYYQVKEIAHQLKGSSSNIRANNLKKIAMNIELACNDKPIDNQISEMIENLEKEFNIVSLSIESINNQ